MKLLIVYHSIYGHVQTMAKAVQEGAQEVVGIDVVLRRVREFPDYVQHIEAEKGYAYQVYQSQVSIPECTLDDLRDRQTNYTFSEQSERGRNHMR